MNKLDKSINENFKKCVNRPVDSLVQNMYTHNMVKKSATCSTTNVQSKIRSGRDIKMFEPK